MQSSHELSKKSRVRTVCFMGGILLLVGVFATQGLAAVKPPFAGREITVAVLEGGPEGGVSGPLYQWRDRWEQLSGAKLRIAEIPYAVLREKLFTDLITGTGRYDGFITDSMFYGDFIENEFIVPIDQFYGDPRFPEWSKESVLPSLQKVQTWKGTWYGAPNDSDCHTLYYQKDILTNSVYQAQFKETYGYELPVPPKSWEQVYDIAKFFAGWDWNGDGEDDYGAALHLKHGFHGFAQFLSFSAAFSVVPGPTVDRYHNVYYFDPETMEPLINQPGNVKALELLLALLKTGPKSMVAWTLGEAWDFFLRGKAVITWTWGDLGVMAQNEETSAIRGNLGVATLPGATAVWDREKKEFIEFAEPNMVGNTVGGNWHGVISVLSKNPEVAYHLFAFHATEEVSMWNACTGYTGVDIGRTFHFLPPHGPASLDEYVERGWNANDITEYSNASFDNFTAETQISMLRIPGASECYDRFDLLLSKAAVGELTAEQALNQAYKEWVAVIAREGKERLKELYQADIDYKK